MIKLICWDLDGVLVDACEMHYLSLNKALQEMGHGTISRTEHETVFNGLPTKVKLDMLLKQGRIEKHEMQPVWDLKQAYTKDAIKETLKKDEEKIELHRIIQVRGLYSVCVTNSINETAWAMLRQTGQDVDYLITNEMVKNPKPHGEGYIRAMIMYNSMPEETLIVEDSEKGIQAAKSTGAHLLIVSDPSKVTVENVERKLEEINADAGK